MLDTLLIIVLVIALVVITTVGWQLWSHGAINKEEAREVVAEDTAAVKSLWRKMVERIKRLRNKS